MEKIFTTALGVIVILSLCNAYPISSRQYLPHRPGYVPVYIRNGDTPLEDINLDLAEAFHVIHSGRSAGSINNGKAPRSDIENEKNDEVMVVEIVPAASSEKSESSKPSAEDALLDDVDVVDDVKPTDDEVKHKLKKVPSEKEQVNKHTQDEAPASKFIQKIPKLIEE